MHAPAADSSIEQDKHPNIHRILLDATAGAVAGCVSRLVVGPLDVIKIRFQVQLEPIGGSTAAKYKGLGNAFKTIVKEEGVKVTCHAESSTGAQQGLADHFITWTDIKGSNEALPSALQGLWRGTIPGLLLTVPYTAVQFVALQQFKVAARSLGLEGRPCITVHNSAHLRQILLLESHVKLCWRAWVVVHSSLYP